MTTQAEMLCAALARALESAAEKEAPTAETLLDHQREERRKSRATHHRARRSAGHFMEIEDTNTDSSFASRSPHHSRSPIDRTRVSDYQAEWSARDPSAQDNDERFGLWTIQGPKRRPRFAKKAEPGAPTEEIPRSKLPSYLITLRPTTRVALAIVSQRLLHTTVMAAAPPSRASASRSHPHEQRIEYSDNRDLRRPTRQRPLATHVHPNIAEPNDSDYCTPNPWKGHVSWCHLPSRPVGDGGVPKKSPVLGEPPHHCRTTDGEARSLPRDVRGNQTATDDQVLECTHEGIPTYEARSLVCHNCQGLGHKKDICPHLSTCAKCGRQHSVDVQCMDQTSYCRNCKQSGHPGTDAECPSAPR
ncbi:hypothetical protein HPB48_004086 [Haemaphysalis longicornis]|uniref:CCHC-type domain-containing protein n=1 Tax=Haemaphysalis longicornis TaxID=44386 RepID=A0A9J6GMM7_HAELO|nr:hypothetical protein HPB48_004086 [Haemaphysalis longicornis]